MSENVDNHEQKNEKSLVIFGTNFAKLPCFRNSYLYGILGGFGSGLTYFLFTSRTKIATHVGFGSFLTITMVYWFQCRYRYSKTKFEMLRVQELMRTQVAYEGTEVEKELDKKLGNKVDV